MPSSGARPPHRGFLEADLVDDLGDDGFGEDALEDSDESAEEDESEESKDGSSDDDGDGFGDSAFSGGFGGDSFLGGTSGTDGSGFSSSSPDSLAFDGAGEEFFQHALPHERSGMSHWRKRIGDHLDILLQDSLRIARDSGALKTRDLARVTAQ